ncbi:MAG: class I SAM-dependent methyltransferase [Calothrix sp. MO_192.B10]|nr:class I SAM-dependent methyltransferase [Calothrix sp. MO_192.B10]
MYKHNFQKVKQPLGYVTVEPKPTLEELENYYQTTYYQDSFIVNNTGYETEYNEKEIAHRHLYSDMIIYSLEQSCSKELSSSNIRFLEVGCGEGFLLSRAAVKGWDVQGIDFNNYAINKFNPSMANKVEFGDVYNILDKMILSSDQTFDFCVMQNVLEHVIDPKKLLQKLRNILSPKGVIMFIVPNDYSPLQMKALELGIISEETWWSPPDHLSYFNIQNGIAFVEDLGFKVKDIFSTFPVDIFLFHPESNYYKNRERGADAHRARIQIELLMAEAGIDKYLAFCRSLAGCGIGRNFALVIAA